MKNGQIDRRDFWENKILKWEATRYQNPKDDDSVLEKVAASSSQSLTFRMKQTMQFLGPRIKDRRVVELGCGSGKLASFFIQAGAKTYTGYDVAQVAIQKANEEMTKLNLQNQTIFTQSDIADLPDLNSDIVFSLGLFDWLKDSDVNHVFKISKGAEFLHSISEKRFSVQQFFHRLYVYAAYGYRTNGYVPKYHTFEEIADLAEKNGFDAPNIYRNSKLSFGALITSF